jgi:hypothetical protein
MILGIPIACVGAALACYYFIFAPSPQPTLKSQTVLQPSSVGSLESTPSSRGHRLDGEPEWEPTNSYALGDFIEAEKTLERGTASEPVMTSLRPAHTKLEVTGKPTAPPSATKVVRALQPEEIMLLVQQGEKFITDGDIAAARVMFERAAKAGDAAAALALAAAYDPLVLAKLRVFGVDTDVDKARVWYEKAKSMGAAEAAERLNALPTR